MVNRVFQWMERAYAADPSSLGVFRILYASSVLLFAVPIGTRVLGIPDVAFTPPPGLPRLFAGPPGPGWVVGINAGIVLLAGLLLLGWRTRCVSLLLGVALALAFATQYSTGKIIHTIIIPLTPLVMALTDWGARYSVDARRHSAALPEARARQRAWSGRALSLLALALGLAFFSAGLEKAQTGWLATDTSATLGYAFSNMHGTGRDPLLFEPLRRWLPLACWEAMDWSVVFFELGMLLAVPWRRLFRWALVAAVSFHLGVVLLYEIWFIYPLATYAGFVAWSTLLPRRTDHPAFFRLWDRRRGAAGWVLAVALTLAAGGCAMLTQKSVLAQLPKALWFPLVFGPPCLVAGGWAVYRLCQYIAPRPSAPAPALRDKPTGPPASEAVVLFDGVCGICNTWVDFVMRRDRDAVIRFAPLQGTYTQEMLDGLDPEAPPETLLLIDADGLHPYSSAALKAFAKLPQPWRVMGLLLWVPPPLRDAAYRVVAKYRYRVFGRKDACRLPTPEERERFVG